MRDPFRQQFIEAVASILRGGVMLSSELKEALLSRPGPVCTMAEVNNIASVIVKTADAESFQGAVPILYRYELARYDAGAAIRLYLEIRDKEPPYCMEAFLNPAEDLALLRTLASQDVLHIHFYDMAANYVFSKSLRHREVNKRELAQLTEMALSHNEGRELDWGAVKAQFQLDRPLGD